MTPYELAQKEVGTVEWRDGHNPKVLAYFKDAGHSWVQNDETAWCAAFACAMIERAGYDSPKSLRARDFTDYGEPTSLQYVQPGDLLVFSRGPNPAYGHVGFFVKQEGAAITVLGGNQSDAVRESTYHANRLVAVRKGPWGPSESSKQRPRLPRWLRFLTRNK